jgi:hypothetical protein
MKLLLSTSFLLIFTTLLFAQTKDTVLLIPGQRLLESGKLENYKIEYDFIRIKDSSETIIGGLEDEFIISSTGGEKTGLRICHIKFGTNSILDSGLCYLNGLKPIYHRSLQTMKELDLNFDNEKITGLIRTKDETGKKEEAIHYQSSVPLFDSYYEDIIAKTIPLKKGFCFKFPEYIYERGGLVWSSGEIKDTIKINGRNGKTATAWMVEFQEKDAKNTTVRTTTYVILGSNREIISREYKTGNSRLIMKQKK